MQNTIIYKRALKEIMSSTNDAEALEIAERALKYTCDQCGEDSGCHEFWRKRALKEIFGSTNDAEALEIAERALKP